jgi:hypothetical protein
LLLPLLLLLLLLLLQGLCCQPLDVLRLRLLLLLVGLHLLQRRQLQRHGHPGCMGGSVCGVARRRCCCCCRSCFCYLRLHLLHVGQQVTACTQRNQSPQPCCRTDLQGRRRCLLLRGGCRALLPWASWGGPGGGGNSSSAWPLTDNHNLRLLLLLLFLLGHLQWRLIQRQLRLLAGSTNPCCLLCTAGCCCCCKGLLCGCGVALLPLPHRVLCHISWWLLDLLLLLLLLLWLWLWLLV